MHVENLGTYQEVQDIGETPPVQVTIFENNNRLVAEDLFYFKGAIQVQGKEDSTYNIRFFTTKELRLVRVNHNSVFETLDFHKTATTDSIQDYVKKTE